MHINKPQATKEGKIEKRKETHSLMCEIYQCQSSV